MALSELNLKYFAPLRVHVYLRRSFRYERMLGKSHNLYILHRQKEWRQVPCQGEACANQRRANDRRAQDRDPAGS